MIEYNPGVDDIKKRLGVKSQVHSFPLVYTNSFAENLVLTAADYRDLPGIARVDGGFYARKTDTVFLGEKIPKMDWSLGRVVIKDTTRAERIFFAAHELRHAWQKKTNWCKIFAGKITGIIDDPAEIDADAFALAYVFSNHFGFTPEDLDFTLERIKYEAAADWGARWKSAKKISNQYGLESNYTLKQLKKTLIEPNARTFFKDVWFGEKNWDDIQSKIVLFENIKKRSSR